MSQSITLNHDGFILGVPSSELQGPGVYLVDDGHVLSFAPLVAPVEAVVAPDASPSGTTSASDVVAPPVLEQVSNGG